MSSQGFLGSIPDSSARNRQRRGIDSVLVNRLDAGSPDAIEHFRNQPCVSFFHEFMAIEDELPEAQAQRLGVNGVFRLLHYRLKERGAPIALPQEIQKDAAALLTEELLEMRLKEVFPDWTMAKLDRVLPRVTRYYICLTTAVDFLRWKRKLVESPRHHRRCGLTLTNLWKTAIVDAFLQQPEEGVVRFLEPWIQFQGDVPSLLTQTPFLKGVHNALGFVQGRFPRYSEEGLKLQDMIRERDGGVLLREILSYWDDYSVNWFLMRELLHDFTLEPVLLFQEESVV